MRLPSERTLSRITFTNGTPRQLRRLLERWRDGDLETDHYAPSVNQLDSAMMDQANTIIGGYGVEAVNGDDWRSYWCDCAAIYVNMGDTYDATLLYDVESGTVRVTSWGDYVEVKGL